jgi:hypothetical protein
MNNTFADTLTTTFTNALTNITPFLQKLTNYSAYAFHTGYYYISLYVYTNRNKRKNTRRVKSTRRRR